VEGSSQGTAYPETVLYASPPRVGERGKRPLRGRTSVSRPQGRRDASGPMPPRPLLRRPVSPGAYARVPCWCSARRWIEHVERVYRRHYLLVRHQLVATTGGGISLPAVLAVAAAHAAAADFTTGRNSGPLLGQSGAEQGMTAATGRGERTISRARTFLRLVGLATEVQAGRQRTLLERLDSAERGDRARGWTAVYALHHSTTHPVDNPVRITAGQPPDGTPPRSGLVPGSSFEERVVSTGAEHPSGSADGAPRRASTRGGVRKGGCDPGGVGLALSKALRAHPECPGWIRRYSPHAYTAALSRWAQAGWTARDVIQHLNDVTTTGFRVYDTPRNPVKYLLALLHRGDIGERPTLWRDAHADADTAAAAQRNAAAPAQLAAAATAREVGRAALNGAGRAQVRAILTDRQKEGRR